MSGAAPPGASGAARTSELELPRSVRRIWIPVGCVLLTLFFFLHGFPWDRVGSMASERISALTGARVTMRSLSPSLGLLGPGIAAEGVTATLASGNTIELEHARVRPAWSLSWLRGRPALAVDLRGPLGGAAGTAYLGSEPGFDGRLTDLDLAKLPVTNLGPGAAADGRADADADVRLGPDGPRGTLRIDARDGSLSLPNVPLALPFATIHAEVELTDAALVQIGAFDLDGPLLAVQASGSVGRAPFLTGAPLQLEVRLDAKDASVRPLLGEAGLRVGPDGAAQVRVLGTVGQPIVR